MSSSDGDRNAVNRRPQGPDLAQFCALAGRRVRRSVRPVAALVAVAVAMCLAAQAPGTLPVMVLLAVVWRRRWR